MTIRRKLVVWVVALFTAVLLVAGFASVIVLRSQLIGNIDNLLIERSGFLADGFDSGVEYTRPTIPDNAPFLAARDMAILSVDSTGAVTVSIPSGRTDQPDQLPDITGFGPFPVDTTSDIIEVDAVGSDGPTYRAVATPVPDSELTAILAIPIDAARATIRTASLILVLAGALAVTTLGALVWWAIRKGLQPIDDMIGAAGRIADGDLSHRVSAPQPHTEVGQLADALNTMLVQIETAVTEKTESEARMRRLLSDASHELRTPLTSIRGYAELHRRGATSPEQIDRALTRIEHESIRMSGLVDDLLLLARLDQGRPLTAQPVNMSQLIDEVVQDAKAVEPDRPLKFESGGPAAMVTGDDDRLRQAFGNVLANVRCHTPPETPAVVNVLSDGDIITIEVADSGPGLTNEAADKAFERFYQARPDRAGPRSGLGLSIVEAIVKAHHGTVDISTTPGQGFSVTIRLPKAVEPTADATTTIADNPHL